MKLDHFVVNVDEKYQKDKDMIESIRSRKFPFSEGCNLHKTKKGGMFIWAALSEGHGAKDLFDKAILEKVAFVPGDPFYTDGRVANTMRLNYTNASKKVIEEGI